MSGRKNVTNTLPNRCYYITGGLGPGPKEQKLSMLKGCERQYVYLLIIDNVKIRLVKW